MIVSAVGAARLYRGLVESSTINGSAKADSDTGWASSHPAHVCSGHHAPKQRASSGTEGDLVVLNTQQVTTPGSVQTAETVEGGNIV